MLSEGGEYIPDAGNGFGDTITPSQLLVSSTQSTEQTAPWDTILGLAWKNTEMDLVEFTVGLEPRQFLWVFPWLFTLKKSPKQNLEEVGFVLLR